VLPTDFIYCFGFLVTYIVCIPIISEFPITNLFPFLKLYLQYQFRSYTDWN